MKKDGRISEAFVFLNHYLDLCEAIEEGEGQLVDHSDLVQTDFPSNIPIPSRMYLADDVKEHDEVREWVLAISMDQKVDQVSLYMRLNVAAPYNSQNCIFLVPKIGIYRACRRVKTGKVISDLFVLGRYFECRTALFKTTRTAYLRN